MGHGAHVVGGADEHDVREVEGLVDVVVGKGVVLFGVEHFEQGAGGVAAEVGADFVEFIEHENGVVAAAFAQFLDDASGQGADVGAAVAPDVGFVADAAERDADEFSAHAPGDALAEGGLADAGRAAEAEYGAAAGGVELANGEEFEDAFFDLGQVVVVGVEDTFGAGQVEFVFGGLGPGQFAEPLDVVADDGEFGAHGGYLAQAFEFAEGLAVDFFGHPGFFDAVAEFFDFGGALVGLA